MIPTKNKPGQIRWEHEPEGPPRIGSLFLDSGAHSLYTREVIKKGHKKGYAFYETDTFWNYVDDYANFVKENKDVIDHYANVDVIFNPKLSWRVLKYLEKEHKLKPVPVIHWGTDIKWLHRHLDAGYDYIGLGGLGQEVTKSQYYSWADKIYDTICPRPKRLPIVKTHGFAMTAYHLLIRYPWWSVDSASWLKSAAYGMISVPRKTGSKFDFSKNPFNICVSSDSPTTKVRGRNIVNLSKVESRMVMEWLEIIRVPLGSVDKEGEMVEWGVVSHHAARKIANLLFGQSLIDWLPEWPWPLDIHTRNRLLA